MKEKEVEKTVQKVVVKEVQVPIEKIVEKEICTREAPLNAGEGKEKKCCKELLILQGRAS